MPKQCTALSSRLADRVPDSLRTHAMLDRLLRAVLLWAMVEFISISRRSATVGPNNEHNESML